MHNSAFQKIKQSIDKYLPNLDKPIVLDLGSRAIANQKLTHRKILSNFECEYVGVDIVAGNNVDIVMDEPYTIPMEDESVDAIVTGQIIEHIPFVWATFLELTRILKPNGYIFCSAPSRGHEHNPPYDCWRFYPDSYKALAAFSNLQLLEVNTHFPVRKKGKLHFEYSKIPDSEYWGDTVGVFQKTSGFDKVKFNEMAKVVTNWANNHADINDAFSADKKEVPDIYIKHGKFDVTFKYSPEIMVDKVKNSIEKGWYEAKEANAALKYLKKGDRVLELGGGLGFMSAATKSCNLDAYVVIEADPRLIPMISETHKINNVKNVMVHNCIATSDPEALERGYYELQLGNEFWGSTVKEKKNASGTFVKINVTSFETYINTFRPTALLIDIEGGEIDLFTGFDISSVNLIIMEVHPYAIGGQSGVDSIVNQLQKLGLSVAEKIHNDAVYVFTRSI